MAPACAKSARLTWLCKAKPIAKSSPTTIPVHPSFAVLRWLRRSNPAWASKVCSSTIPFAQISLFFRKSLEAKHTNCVAPSLLGTQIYPAASSWCPVSDRCLLRHGRLSFPPRTIVIPAKAGIHNEDPPRERMNMSIERRMADSGIPNRMGREWIPAFAGMTVWVVFAGMTV